MVGSTGRRVTLFVIGLVGLVVGLLLGRGVYWYQEDTARYNELRSEYLAPRGVSQQNMEQLFDTLISQEWMASSSSKITGRGDRPSSVMSESDAPGLWHFISSSFSSAYHLEAPTDRYRAVAEYADISEAQSVSRNKSHIKKLLQRYGFSATQIRYGTNAKGMEIVLVEKDLQAGGLSNIWTRVSILRNARGMSSVNVSVS